MKYNQNINGILTELPRTNSINISNGKKSTKKPMQILITLFIKNKFKKIKFI
jgi:hypothetical protein